MKKFIKKKIRGSIVMGAVLLFGSHCPNLHAQQSTDKDKSSVKVGDFNEKQVREAMKRDGLSDASIDKWVLERKLLYPKGQNSTPVQSHKISNVNASGTCADMGAEGGWSVWQAATGEYLNGIVTINATGLAPTAPRFNITTGAGTDPCTPGPATGDPSISVVAPGFGNASIELGQPRTNGQIGGCNQGCVEQLTFNLQVTPADTNFIYAYAILLEDPQPAHTGKQVPYAEIYMLDQNGDTVKCSHHKYMGDTTGKASVPPGMYAASCNGPGTNGMDVAYEPWTINGIDLAKYVGTTVKVVITNVDCGLGGHFCYSYWDFMCPPVTGSQFPFCAGQQTTLVAPASLPDVPFTYTWYHNGAIYSGLPSSTSQSITPTPLPGDTFNVYVQQPSGCNFWLPFIPQQTTIIPDFTFTGTCGRITFKDSSTVSPVSTNNTVKNWNWQFPGGTPANSTSQNPGTIIYPAGTYTVSLIVTSTAGCKDTIRHSFTVGGSPTAQFQPTIPCLGASTSLTDWSIASQGDPIKSWNWTMTGGMPASATTSITSTIYSTAGTHSVTLIITTQSGCKDTITQQVLVYHPPVALFNDRDSGCAPVCHSFTDLSQAVDGSIVDWAWSFPGGNPSASVQKNPGPICYYTPGTYGGSVMVTTNYGCKNSLKLDNIIHVYSWPNADFCVAPDKAPATDPVFNFCNLCSSDVVQWMWDFGDGTTDNINPNPTHSYLAVATTNDFYNYKICLKAQNQYGCWDTICKPVEIIPEFEFYIPNCFTPNSDNTNELFFGKSRGVKDYNIWVFDRWGNQLWDCHYTGKNTDFDMPGSDGMSSACKWDGIVVKGGMDMSGNSGQLAQEDVYVWKVRLTDIFDKKHNYIGHVSIVK